MANSNQKTRGNWRRVYPRTRTKPTLVDVYKDGKVISLDKSRHTHSFGCFKLDSPAQPSGSNSVKVETGSQQQVNQHPIFEDGYKYGFSNSSGKLELKDEVKIEEGRFAQPFTDFFITVNEDLEECDANNLVVGGWINSSKTKQGRVSKLIRVRANGKLTTKLKAKRKVFEDSLIYLFALEVLTDDQHKKMVRWIRKNFVFKSFSPTKHVTK